MAAYSMSASATCIQPSQACCDMVMSGAGYGRLIDYTILQAQGIAATYGFGRPGNDGSVMQQMPMMTLIPDNPNDPPSQCSAGSAWTVAPTIPVQFLRRVYLPATMGAGVCWTWPRGAFMTPNHGFCHWNFTIGGVSVMNYIVEE